MNHYLILIRTFLFTCIFVSINQVSKGRSPGEVELVRPSRFAYSLPINCLSLVGPYLRNVKAKTNIYQKKQSKMSLLSRVSLQANCFDCGEGIKTAWKNYFLAYYGELFKGKNYFSQKNFKANIVGEIQIDPLEILFSRKSSHLEKIYLEGDSLTQVPMMIRYLKKVKSWREYLRDSGRKLLFGPLSKIFKSYSTQANWELMIEEKRVRLKYNEESFISLYFDPTYLSHFRVDQRGNKNFQELWAQKISLNDSSRMIMLDVFLEKLKKIDFGKVVEFKNGESEGTVVSINNLIKRGNLSTLSSDPLLRDINNFVFLTTITEGVFWDRAFLALYSVLNVTQDNYFDLVIEQFQFILKKKISIKNSLLITQKMDKMFRIYFEGAQELYFDFETFFEQARLLGQYLQDYKITTEVHPNRALDRLKLISQMYHRLKSSSSSSENKVMQAPASLRDSFQNLLIDFPFLINTEVMDDLIKLDPSIHSSIIENLYKNFRP